MTKKSNLTILFGMSLGLLSACSTTTNLAPVVDRNGAPVGAAKQVVEDVSKERDPALYTVRKGDTMIRIALEHGQNYRDLVAWNNLSNPNDIKVDQVLRVLPPEPGSAAAGPGVQTSAVLMPPSIETRQPGTSPVVKKTAPRGEKRPYSDATLAEMQRSDSAAPAKPGDRNGDGIADAPAVPAAPQTPVSRQVTAPPAAAADDEKLSWMWPSDGKVIATFDEGKNKGIDIAGKAGQQVLAAGAGRVMYAGSGIRGYGNLVIVKHSNSLLSAYAHNRTILVKEGQTVNKGQMIAEMGDSDADAVMLHFEIRQQGKPVDPSKFLPNR
ncbi:MAG TPA: peptidoglycan DD-metalloendopeptidase family protein [Janthinobacterium sp.]|jgi:lipoprotein NlpD|nr:peptidoglycan DD-metalloendopeptidase family protein [Janthinobacterium sp.]